MIINSLPVYSREPWAFEGWFWELTYLDAPVPSVGTWIVAKTPRHMNLDITSKD